MKIKKSEFWWDFWWKYLRRIRKIRIWRGKDRVWRNRSWGGIFRIRRGRSWIFRINFTETVFKINDAWLIWRFLAFGLKHLKCYLIRPWSKIKLSQWWWFNGLELKIIHRSTIWSIKYSNSKTSLNHWSSSWWPD